LPFIPWFQTQKQQQQQEYNNTNNTSTMNNQQPSTRRNITKNKNKKEWIKPELTKETIYPPFRSSTQDNDIHPNIPELLAIQARLNNNGSAPATNSTSSFEISNERRKIMELQKQMQTLAILLHQKTEEVEEMNERELAMEERLGALTEALEDKRLQVQQHLQATRKQLTEIEEERLTEDEMWELDQLIELSIQAKEHSYSPYSKFRVGCILKTQSGEYYKGCNVENASYGLAICAERTALVKAVSEGHKKFSMIVINSDLATTFCAPCGACRQFMAEFGDFSVYLTKPDKSYKKFTVSDLLPESFTPKDLAENKVQK